MHDLQEADDLIAATDSVPTHQQRETQRADPSLNVARQFLASLAVDLERAVYHERAVERFTRGVDAWTQQFAAIEAAGATFNEPSQELLDHQPAESA